MTEKLTGYPSSRSIDHRNLVIADLASAEADDAERLGVAEDRARVWELFAKVALHRVHELAHERDAARAQVAKLRQELRVLVGVERETGYARDRSAA